MWDSWGRSACYPQGNLALSVERWHFHSHTTGSLTPTFVSARPVSLAVRLAFAFALFGLVSVQAERFFVTPPLLFWRRPPQPNCPPDNVRLDSEEAQVENSMSQGWYPTSLQNRQSDSFPSVPSILCMQHRNPISGYSKAPWGLSVLSRVTGIFTGTTISPGGLLRQCPDHYAFHAGQNLPDKEFRYLRTVIVTAAVHWGFNSMLAHLLLTFQHRAGVSSYTSSFDLAQTCVFGKQLPGPILCGSLS